MFVFYELFKGTSPAEDVYEFCLSSDGKTNKVFFYDKAEKSRHALITQFFRNIDGTVRTYDASNYTSCIIGIAGNVLLEVIKSAIVQGLLKGVEIKEIKNLQSNLTRGNLSYIPPKPTEVPKIDIKFDEADFFKKPEVVSTELSGTALQEALAEMLDIDLARLKILAPLDLKSIYRKKARELHPDFNAGNGEKMSQLNYLWRLYNA